MDYIYSKQSPPGPVKNSALTLARMCACWPCCQTRPPAAQYQLYGAMTSQWGGSQR